MIQNIESIEHLINDPEKLATGAQLYQRFASIKFKILRVDEESKEVILRIVQKKNQREQYLELKALIERGKELLLNHLPEGYRVHARSYTFDK